MLASHCPYLECSSNSLSWFSCVLEAVNNSYLLPANYFFSSTQTPFPFTFQGRHGHGSLCHYVLVLRLMGSKVLARLCDPGTGPDYVHIWRVFAHHSLTVLLCAAFPVEDGSFLPGAPTKLLTVEPAGIMGFCSETRILAQAAKDGEVPAHEVRCHPGVQFFPCRQGKGVFSQLQTIEVKVAQGVLGVLRESRL